MAQTVNLWGATYNGVPAIDVPSGSGAARFTDVSDTTSEASDVLAGKYFYTAEGIRTLGTGTGGGGGASNVVTGTFKGTTTGAAMDVTLNYTGSGFPVALLIYPDGGKPSIQSINQRYIIENLYCVKDYPGETPQYSGSYRGIDTGDLCFIYRNAAIGSTSHSKYASYSGSLYNDQAATGSQSAVIQFRSSTKMSVFIAGTSYGFVANVDYKYWVIYSS